MSGHTPRPWSYADDGKSVWGDDGAEVICSIYECDSSQDSSAFYGEITQANARLIAAAPELLAVLMQIQRMGYTDLGDKVMVDEVIAKATGESP